MCMGMLKFYFYYEFKIYVFFVKGLVSSVFLFVKEYINIIL